MEGQSFWPQGGVALAQRLPDGTLALAGNRTLLLVRGGRAVKRLTVGKEIPGTRIQTLLADREGSLWIGTNGGLARLVGEKLQLFRSVRTSGHGLRAGAVGGPRRQSLGRH